MRGGKQVLEVLLYEHIQHGAMSLPGNHVSPSERIPFALLREMTQAVSELKLSKDEGNLVQDRMRNIFVPGIEISRGIVDDARNTDNAWLETVATNYHDESGDIFHRLKLQSQDPVLKLVWMDTSAALKTRETHQAHIDNVAMLRDAYCIERPTNVAPAVKRPSTSSLALPPPPKAPSPAVSPSSRGSKLTISYPRFNSSSNDEFDRKAREAELRFVNAQRRFEEYHIRIKAAPTEVEKTRLQLDIESGIVPVRKNSLLVTEEQIEKDMAALQAEIEIAREGIKRAVEERQAELDRERAIKNAALSEREQLEDLFRQRRALNAKVVVNLAEEQKRAEELALKKEREEKEARVLRERVTLCQETLGQQQQNLKIRLSIVTTEALNTNPEDDQIVIRLRKAVNDATAALSAAENDVRHAEEARAKEERDKQEAVQREREARRRASKLEEEKEQKAAVEEEAKRAARLEKERAATEALEAAMRKAQEQQEEARRRERNESLAKSKREEQERKAAELAALADAQRLARKVEQARLEAADKARREKEEEEARMKQEEAAAKAAAIAAAEEAEAEARRKEVPC